MVGPQGAMGGAAWFGEAQGLQRQSSLYSFLLHVDWIPSLSKPCAVITHALYVTVQCICILSLAYLKYI